MGATSSKQTSANTSQTSTESGNTSSGNSRQTKALSEEPDDTLQTSSDEATKYAESQKKKKNTEGIYRRGNPRHRKCQQHTEKKSNAMLETKSHKTDTTPSTTNMDDRPLRPMLSTTLNTTPKGNTIPKTNKGTPITRPNKPNKGGRITKAQPKPHQSRR